MKENIFWGYFLKNGELVIKKFSDFNHINDIYDTNKTKKIIKPFRANGYNHAKQIINEKY